MIDLFRDYIYNQKRHSVLLPLTVDTRRKDKEIHHKEREMAYIMRELVAGLMLLICSNCQFIYCL